MNNIEKTIKYLQNLFENSPYLKDKEDQKRYRLEHTYRVASIAKDVALKEGLHVEGAVIGALLHDVSYIEEMKTNEERRNHGRRSVEIVRDFVERLDLDEQVKEELLYGIAIHVDDEAGYEGKRTLLSELIGEADNIDRFDYYRLYEGLLYANLDKMDVDKQMAFVQKKVDGLKSAKKYIFKTKTSNELWQESLDRQLAFYQGLFRQLKTTDPRQLIG